jgi:oligoribonuclease NrnB/cAMP/cGMP phosphodiesterase (DHH superfamily)
MRLSKVHTPYIKKEVNMAIRCFYHSSDLDGHCSGAIVKRKYPDCVLHPINYKDPFPWDVVNEDDTVFMVDFSLQPFSDMVKLNTMCSLRWIDHHATAMQAYRDQHDEILGHRWNGVGACQLVWEYLYPEDEVPLAVRLLAEYDVWNHKDPRALPFQYGMRLYNTDPENQSSWEQYMTDQFVEETGYRGEVVLDYIRQDNAKYIKAAAFECMAFGLKAIVVNRMLTNSQLFDSVWDNEKYDIMVTFGWMKDSWVVYLYTDKPGVDVSQIAKENGGGGHKGAAGFHCETLPSFLGEFKWLLN